MNAPLLSIITPCLNRAKYIEEAVQSVLCQSYQNIEHIIIDGGSIDGTLGILARYPHLRIISGPDKGIYDALNKGLALSKGEIIGFLNSDDLYAMDGLAVSVKQFEDSSIKAVAGRAEVFLTRPDGATEIVATFSPEGVSLLESATLGSPYFNAWLFQRSVFEKLGDFSVDYQIAADRDFMMRFSLSNMKYAIADALVYRYRHHEGAKTFDVNTEKLKRIVREQILVADSYLQQTALPAKARRLIAEACTRETLDASVRAIKERNFSFFIYCVLAGSRHNPFWIVRFLQRAKEKYFR